ncbi:MAG: hypothetical protein Q7S73_02775 [bacterium]|nr:hypothetical protein [bacterium]
MAEENPVESYLGFDPDKVEDYKNNLKLAVLYNDYLQKMEQDHFLRILNDDEKIELAKRILRNRVQLAIQFDPQIRIFSNTDKILKEGCLIPVRVKDLKIRTFASEDGVVYIHDPIKGILCLSISYEDYIKMIPSKFGPNNPLHIELILRNEEEKVHCFPDVRVLTRLDPSEKTGKHLLSLNAL